MGEYFRITWAGSYSCCDLLLKLSSESSQHELEDDLSVDKVANQTRPPNVYLAGSQGQSQLPDAYTCMIYMLADAHALHLCFISTPKIVSTAKDLFGGACLG